MDKRTIRTLRTINSTQQHHGYQEWYYENILNLRGYAKHGQPYAYEEWHDKKLTRFHIR